MKMKNRNEKAFKFYGLTLPLNYSVFIFCEVIYFPPPNQHRRLTLYIVAHFGWQKRRELLIAFAKDASWHCWEHTLQCTQTRVEMGSLRNEM